MFLNVIIFSREFTKTTLIFFLLRLPCSIKFLCFEASQQGKTGDFQTLLEVILCSDLGYFKK